MSVTLVKPSTTDPVDNPTVVSGQVGDDLTVIVALRNASGGSINSFEFVPGVGISAEWQSESPPLSIANNQQQNIVLTIDSSVPRDAFDTTFQVNTSGADPIMNLQLNIEALPEPPAPIRPRTGVGRARRRRGGRRR